MASTNTIISVQIDKKDKEQATKILQKLGVSLSGLINMTIKQVIMKKRIPFEIALSPEENNISKYFSKKELDAMAKELKNMEKHPEKYESYNTIKELFEALDSED